MENRSSCASIWKAFIVNVLFIHNNDTAAIATRQMQVYMYQTITITKYHDIFPATLVSNAIAHVRLIHNFRRMLKTIQWSQIEMKYSIFMYFQNEKGN